MCSRGSAVLTPPIRVDRVDRTDLIRADSDLPPRHPAPRGPPKPTRRPRPPALRQRLRRRRGGDQRAAAGARRDRAPPAGGDVPPLGPLRRAPRQDVVVATSRWARAEGCGAAASGPCEGRATGRDSAAGQVELAVCRPHRARRRMICHVSR